MNKKLTLLILFAVLILAVISGALWFALQRDSFAPQRQVLTDFFSAVQGGQLNAARALLLREDRDSLREPMTALSEAVYREMSLTAVDRIIRDDESSWVADVRVKGLNTMQIISKADSLFYERLVTIPEPTDEAVDQLINEIYDELLSRDDLPTEETFLIVTLRLEDGLPRIDADEKLTAFLEGNIEKNLSALQELMRIMSPIPTDETN